MVFPRSRKAEPPRADLSRPWEAGEPIPVPEAVHTDGDLAWQLWMEATQQYEARFADTIPMGGPVRRPAEDRGWAGTQPGDGSGPLARTLREAQPLFSLESAMVVARRNNRVCPRPQRWNEFCALLQPRKTLRGTVQPPAPATGAAWAVTPPLTKRLCFREQIEWAERSGALEAVMDFMHSLPEEDWLHIGED